MTHELETSPFTRSIEGPRGTLRKATEAEKRWERVHIEADRRKPFAFVREVWL